MNNNPMTQERLDAIQERVDDMWETDANFVAAYAREDVPALLAEVERLRALTTVDEGMVERAAKVLRDRLRINDMTGDDSPWEELPENVRGAWCPDARAVLDAALGTGEGA